MSENKKVSLADLMREQLAKKKQGNGNGQNAKKSKPRNEKITKPTNKENKQPT
ncbi:hypothetical protein ACT7DF_28910 [Bacillus cereus]